MPTETPMPADHPIMQGWQAWRATEDGANSAKWAIEPQHTDGSLWSAYLAGWTNCAQQTHRATLDADLVEILGKPNFMCSPLAAVMRLDGAAIPKKAEAEQAHVIHWLLNLYLLYGREWRREMHQSLERMLRRHDQRQAAEIARKAAMAPMPDQDAREVMRRQVGE